MAYDYAPFPYTAPPGLTAAEPRHPVVIVGAGPIGLALAIDLAQRGVKSVVLDDNNVVSVGSRAICWAKRTLEIFDRLGVGERMLDKGVTWKVGRLFLGQQIEAVDLIRAVEQPTDLPCDAFVQHPFAHAQPVEDFQRALGPADGA
ncbi:MAG: FAD-dependent oxidoreductase, partial [Pseudomonadota bacterium]